MFPISHVYMLNRLVNRKFGRNLDSRDAEQIMGSWLLDAIVNKDMRKDNEFDAQAYFHNLDMYSPKDKLQAGVLIHIMSDTLASYNALRYPYDKKEREKKEGFLGSRERLLYVPHEDEADKKEDLRRRMLQCGLDMLIIAAAKDDITRYFYFATSLFDDEKMYGKVYGVLVSTIKNRMKKPNEKIHPSDDFINNILKNTCDNHLKQYIENYSKGLEYMMCDWRRAKAAMDYAGYEYCKETSMVDLIRCNLITLQGWQRDIDKAAAVLVQGRPDIFQTFSK